MSSPVQVYWVKRIDNRRLVRQRDPSYIRESGALVGSAVVCLAIVLLCAWQHFAFIHSGYQLEEIRARHEQVLEWNQTLHLEEAALLDPMRIDALARNRLGLGAPGADQVVPLGSQEGTGAAPSPVLAQAKDSTGAQRPPKPSLTD